MAPRDSITSAVKLNLSTSELRARNDLMAIDGILYDLKSFAPLHPGGEVIASAGAYDATALYHSMHLGQNPMKSELLQRFNVGTYDREDICEPVYTYNSAFAQDLIKTVRKEMGATSWYAPIGFWIRTALICTMTLVFEYKWITTGSIMFGILVACMHSQIGLSVQHDASHGALSSNPTVNALFSYGADWIGNSRWIWLQQHILWHHPFTNHHEYDPDASSAEPLLVFSDYSILKKSAHKKPLQPAVKFQDYITHLVLSLYGPSLVYNVLAILNMQHNEHIPDSVSRGKFMSRQKPTAILFRLFYLLRMVLAPWYIGGASLYVSSFLVSMVTGIFLTFLFVVSHNFEGSDRDPLKLVSAAAAPAASTNASKSNNNKKNIKNSGPAATDPICWYKAQVETSCTYGGTLAMIMTGGLNMQIEHHLFPRLSSWYYPKIQTAVEQCCRRHGVAYKYYPSLLSNTISMLKYMRQVGVLAVLAQAD